DRERAERRGEDEGNHIERRFIVALVDTDGEHDRGHGTDYWEEEQIRPVEPPVHDPEIFGERISEHGDEKNHERNRQIGNETVGPFPHIGLAFPDEPAGAEKGVTETEANAANHPKWR